MASPRPVDERPSTTRRYGIHDASAQVDAGATIPAATRRILIADDNADAAEPLEMWLKMAGHHVRSAQDGEAALVLAETMQPDVLLLDIGMPRLNGYEVARRIRAKPCGARAMLIALTGWGQEEDLRRSREVGSTTI